MKRQFLRVYIGIAVVLVAAIIATNFIIKQEIRSLINARTEDMIGSVVSGIREELATTAEISQTITKIIQRLNSTRRIKAERMPLNQLDLSQADQERVRHNEPVFLHRKGRHSAYIYIENNEVLVIKHWMRKSRGNRSHWLWLLRDEYFLLGVLLVSLCLIGTAAYLLLQPFERRIYALADVANRFGQGQLNSRAPDQNQDAIGTMGSAFNDMANHIEDLIGRQKDLLRAVSHEFRTPLARLFFMVDNAQNVSTPEDKNRILERIEDSLQDLNGLVEELLAFVRLEGDTTVPEKECIDVASVLADMPNIAADLRPELTFTMPSTSAQIHVIPYLFKRAVLNIVTNAVHHAEHQIKLSYSLQKEHLVVCIDDDGPGIPPEDREHIFEPFFRLDKSRHTDSGGVGLGLAIVQRIMNLHAGYTAVETNSLNGTRISLYFPIHAPHPT